MQFYSFVGNAVGTGGASGYELRTVLADTFFEQRCRHGCRFWLRASSSTRRNFPRAALAPRLALRATNFNSSSTVATDGVSGYVLQAALVDIFFEQHCRHGGLFWLRTSSSTCRYFLRAALSPRWAFLATNFEQHSSILSSGTVAAESISGYDFSAALVDTFFEQHRRCGGRFWLRRSCSTRRYLLRAALSQHKTLFLMRTSNSTRRYLRAALSLRRAFQATIFVQHSSILSPSNTLGPRRGRA